MRRRLRRVLSLTGLAVAVAAGVAVIRPGPERASLENYRFIHEGMTRAEVVAVLGGPPGDYRTAPTRFEYSRPSFRRPRPLPQPDGTREEHWADDAVALMVCFSDEGTVRYSCPVPTSRREGTTLEVLRWRIARHWRRWFPE